MDKSGNLRVSLTESGQVSVAITLNDKAKQLGTMLKMDFKNCPVRHYLASIDTKLAGEITDEERAQLLLAKEELINNYDQNSSVVWPNNYTQWRDKITDFTLLAAVIIGAYKAMFSHFELEEREIDIEIIDASIISGTGAAIVRAASPPEVVTVVIGGNTYSLVGNPIPVPDPVALNLKQQQTAYRAGLESLKEEHNRRIEELRQQLAALSTGQRLFPNWYTANDYYEASGFIGLVPHYNYQEYCVNFTYPNTSIKFVSRGDVVKELKEPIPYPPLLVKVFISGNRFKTAMAFNMLDLNNSFGSFHISSSQCCTGDIKFANLNTYRDLKEWYSQLNKGMLQMCNLGSPYHPSYGPHEQFYNLFFPGGAPFTWPSGIFKETSNVVSL